MRIHATGCYPYSAGTSNDVCMAKTHTSCSSDIVGDYGDEDCGMDLLVTGWRDGNPNDSNDCDNGPAAGGVPVRVR